MRSQRGFTLIEVAVTVALAAIVAALAITTVTAARRNASVGSTAWELATRFKGLRGRALGDQRDLVFVAVDAQGNDARGCGALAPARCARWFLLAPEDGWSFASFDPASPATDAEIVDSEQLPRGIRLHLGAVDRPGPVPFDSARVLDSALTRACGADGALCVAFRYSRNGEVRAEPPTTDPVTAAGVAIPLGSDLVGEHRGADARAVLVGFPSGIVRSYGLAP